jgi:CRISPR-associated protein Cas2
VNVHKFDEPQELTAIRYMYYLVFFDLPTLTKEQRKAYSIFRKKLLRKGFAMLQFSMYYCVCPNIEGVTKKRHWVSKNLPSQGHIRGLTLTRQQFARMDFMLGTPTHQETNIMLNTRFVVVI